MSRVVCRNISKRFGAVEVLRGVDLEIESGEFLVMLGPSGCGKSTLLRIIAGIENQNGGSVSIDDEVVDAVHPRERDVAMVFQNYALYPLMTARQNLAFALKIRKTPTAEIDRRVNEVAHILGLEEHLERRPAQLSGGQRQRVAMGRAMMRNPRVFLFDEPLSNLDARLRTKMRAEIKSLQIALRATAIYVTHDQIEAMTMGDRIVVMADGGIEQIGSPDEIYSAPVNLYVASFIGSPEINILRGVCDNGACAIEGARLPLPPGAPATGDILYCARPHDLAPAAADEEGSFAARVDFFEPTGAAHIVHARVGAQKIVMQTEADDKPPPRPGEEIRLRIKSERAHLFDPQSQRRLGRAA